MPQFGRAAVATIEAAGVAPPAPWTFPGALAQVITFEVDAEATLDLLPPMLSRPAPPYARLMIADYPETPIGPYREALLLLSCRYLMIPRQYIVTSAVTSEAAVTANAANWQYASTLGEVTLAREGDGFTGRVILPSGLEITATSPTAQETAPATIRYDPQIVVSQGDGSPAVLTVSADPSQVQQAWLAQASTVQYSGGDRGGPWLRLRSKNPITGTIARHDLTRPAPAPVEPPPPGSGGGLP